MDTINISYTEIVDFYKKLGIDTRSEDDTTQFLTTPAGWEMPTAFDNTPLVFSNSATNTLQGLR